MNADWMKTPGWRATVIKWGSILTICVFSYLIIVPKFIGTSAHPPGLTTRAEMSHVATAILTLAVDCGREKITPEILPDACSTNLGWPKWHGPYLAPGPYRDEWGTDLRYKITGTKLRIESAGRDKQFDTKDDIFDEFNLLPMDR